MDDKARNSLILIGTLALLGFIVYIIPHLSAIKELSFKMFMNNIWLILTGGFFGIYIAVKKFIKNDYSD